MLAGVAHVDFTPAPGLILQGHFSTTPSTGVLHPLEARAAAFCIGERTVIVITLDVIGVSIASTTRIRQRLQSAAGIHPNNVMVAASHTHCAPATIDLLGLTPAPEFLASVEDAAVQCATKAIADLRPARLALGTSSAYFNVNRRPLPGATTQFSVNYSEICDKRVRILRVDDLRGRPLTLLFHYACHPTTFPGSKGLISSDYPGVARSYIEHDLGCPALFLPGCFGNIRPLVLDSAGNFIPANAEQLDSIGRELASATVRAARSIKTADADLLDARQTELVLPYSPPPTAAEFRAIQAETSPAAIAVKHPWAARVLSATALPAEVRSAMQLLRIGPLSLLSMPGEPVQEIGHAIERLAAAVQPDLWPVGYSNDMLGYLVTEPQKIQGGYEPTAYPYFNHPATFRDEQFHLEQAAMRLLSV
ncbi:MAG TPA: neutral/alkaline non-lysosomal ceramidase N-terminal domain-containing protein [Tepidisphaeraceae bacterium]|jgi:hypothetical protein|nr:neutral/alkaline non-lysosomal ceramidase N-terminal domain-containing protein [Tepidisphaeraceae bacterium]